MLDHPTKQQRLQDEIRRAGGEVRLAKRTTNLFRNRVDSAGGKLDVRDFDQVIAVDAGEGWVEAEGMATYAALVDACLPYGVAPAVVPELKSITAGGAVSGTGLESSSFRHGFVHETVLEMDVLLADGSVVTCTPRNNHSDLFFGFANSYGTLGYVLKLKLKTVPTKPYVHTRHTRFGDAAGLFAEMRRQVVRPDVDFVEGVSFAADSYVLTVGTFADAAPYTSDYTYLNVYHRSLMTREEDYLTVKDYLWRWDTDWFWCSNSLYAQNPIVRRLLGRKRLNSIFYMDVMRWNRRWRVMERLQKLKGTVTEAVIQDVEIPIDNAARFLDFYHREIGQAPIILGPVVGSTSDEARFPLFPLDPATLYVNVGAWGTVPTRPEREPGYLNKLIERKTAELGGIKMLYSDSYYDEETFWRIYDKTAYDALKNKYDPDGRLAGLYDKTVLRR